MRCREVSSDGVLATPALGLLGLRGRALYVVPAPYILKSRAFSTFSLAIAN